MLLSNWHFIAILRIVQGDLWSWFKRYWGKAVLRTIYGSTYPVFAIYCML